eukprot:CAMPEP_0179217580 /NCGR_PEP_ID=MMETSP0797-20121207/3996_1 /TAXON_ID=47934 /ORGANISM="Dinophysis acuminata, Strain DAEP01" /LENGTH=370 /DNA_ID=CAMNT_0020923831 /DNA_START=131 /DNA_END=1240 /DNA_ORIENTATION=+
MTSYRKSCRGTCSSAWNDATSPLVMRVASPAYFPATRSTSASRSSPCEPCPFSLIPGRSETLRQKGQRSWSSALVASEATQCSQITWKQQAVTSGSAPGRKSAAQMGHCTSLLRSLAPCEFQGAPGLRAVDAASGGPAKQLDVPAARAQVHAGLADGQGLGLGGHDVAHRLDLVRAVAAEVVVGGPPEPRQQQLGDGAEPQRPARRPLQLRPGHDLQGRPRGRVGGHLPGGAQLRQEAGGGQDAVVGAPQQGVPERGGLLRDRLLHRVPSPAPYPPPDLVQRLPEAHEVHHRAPRAVDAWDGGGAADAVAAVDAEVPDQHRQPPLLVARPQELQRVAPRGPARGRPCDPVRDEINHIAEAVGAQDDAVRP